MNGIRFSGVIILHLCLFVSTAASQSVVYSPSLLLTTHPLERGAWALHEGATMLAEARPRRADGTITPGFEIAIRHAPFDGVAIGVKGWTGLAALSRGDRLRSGISVEGMVTLPGSDAHRTIALMPRAAISLEGSVVQGWGMQIPLVLWLPRFGVLGAYCGIGPMMGFRTVATEKSSKPLARFGIFPNPRQTWGYGVGSNLGASIGMGRRFNIYVELAGVIETELYEGETCAFVAPSGGIAWSF